MMLTALILYSTVMYAIGTIDAIAIKQTMTWKDMLFLAFAPVTIPCKMVVILWVLVRPPFW